MLLVLMAKGNLIDLSDVHDVHVEPRQGGLDLESCTKPFTNYA